MKKVFVLLMAFGIVATSCNNKKDEKKPPVNDEQTKDDNKPNDDGPSISGWSQSEKDSWMKLCADPLKEKLGEDKATNYCRCVLEKIQERYPTYNEANTKGTEEEGVELGKACASEITGN